MNLENLSLTNFRNIDQAVLTPAPQFNVFWGDNAQGKTNLLEAIYLLATLKSFRSAKNEDFIRHGKVDCRIAAEVCSLKVRHRMDLSITSQGKSPRIDAKEARYPERYLGLLHPVLFSPEEVGIVKGFPAGRRALLDRAVFQTDQDFLLLARNFSRCLKQRNQLLKNGTSSKTLEPWSEQLIQAGARLRQARTIYLNRMVPLLHETYRSISGDKEQADLQYPGAGEDLQELENSLRADLQRCADRELRQGITLAGPHRDDPQFLIDGRSLRLYGSQGQQRSYMLAFKTAQIMDLEQRTGQQPVLLLDDMTSELDRRRQGFFFRFLLERRGQVFITTTDVQPLLNEGLHQARFYRVENGSLQQDRQE